MQIEFLGTAGYHPSEARHTSCVYLPDAAPDCGFVLDAGTGFFRLAGRALPPELHIFLSHAHLDHVCGLTYLLDVLWKRECRVTVYGTPETLRVVTDGLFNSLLFPLPFEHETHPVEAGRALEIGGARVSAFSLTHPGGSLAYRFDWETASLAYVTDTAGDGRYVPFIRDVDLLIHERNFTDDLRQRADASGHCTSEAVARAARQARVKRLALTHFNPLTPGDPVGEDALQVERPDAVFARDGLILEL